MVVLMFKMKDRRTDQQTDVEAAEIREMVNYRNMEKKQILQMAQTVHLYCLTIMGDVVSTPSSKHAIKNRKEFKSLSGVELFLSLFSDVMPG